MPQVSVATATVSTQQELVAFLLHGTNSIRALPWTVQLLGFVLCVQESLFSVCQSMPRIVFFRSVNWEFIGVTPARMTVHMEKSGGANRNWNATADRKSVV